ncbi:MAG: molybdopterin-dependent oxidoreductase [Acidimicrobiia bacterium]|nr:molybdopterin-dependent oxidoreductase [Acidimicrobiia bacterium]
MSVETVLGTCHHDCPDTCGWIATVEDGIAVKLRGNPAHPYSRGELCPKVNRFLHRVYSPDRLLQPLIRSGPKGAGLFEPVSWNAALDRVAEMVREIVAIWGGEAVLPWWDAGTQGLIQMSSLDRRFFGRLGASRLVGSLCGGTAGAGTAATNGTGLAADPMSIRFSKLILLWATNTKLTNRHLWPFIEEAKANGAEVVVIDPIRTSTAQAADWFIQPLPGTDVALMLAMMNVLIRDDLVDSEYVEDYTVGYEELADRVAGWPPERAADACGVPALEIERLAHAYGAKRPAMIRTLIGAEHHENGAMFFRTLACLPALTGSWRDRGGGLARSVGSWADRNVDDAVFDWPGSASRRTINMNHLGRALTDSNLDPPVKALFVWNGNPAVTVPNAAAIRQGLAREDLFTVVSEQFMTDTARFADVVFPATTQLEQVDLVPSWGHLYLGWNEPAIEPLGEAVPNTELWRRLSRAMGFTETELFEGDESLISSALTGVNLETLRADGFVRVDVPEDLRPYANGSFGTPHGKVELFSRTLAESGHDPLPDFIPARESPAGDPDLAARYPLVLLTPKHHTRFLNSSYSHLPKHGPVEGGPFVELDPSNAQERSIGEGDLLEIWNDRARLRLPARITNRLRPGVVAVPFGWWSDHHGGRATANSLTNDTLTDWGGGVAYSDTLVEIGKVG